MNYTCTALLLVPCLLAGCDPARPLGSKERALFPPAVACSTADHGGYRVLLNGMLFRESWATRNQTLLEDWLDLEELIPDATQRETLRTRLRPILASKPSGRYVTLRVGNRLERVGPSGVKGLITQELFITQQEVDTLRSASPEASITLNLVVAPDNPQLTAIPVYPVSPTGLSVISDIDDTIRVTEVLNTKRMVRNMLMNEVRAVAGMPEVYRKWSALPDVSFHYLTSSPYQIFPSLREFLATQYPPGSVHMRHVCESGVKAILSLMSTPKGYKVEAMSRLLDAMPSRQFVLVGDSGEHDPESYVEVARRHPGQVRRIFIRNVTCEPAGSDRYRALSAGLPEGTCRVFQNASEIQDGLADLVKTPG